jgi:hypothetical protein
LLKFCVELWGQMAFEDLQSERDAADFKSKAYRNFLEILLNEGIGRLGKNAPLRLVDITITRWAKILMGQVRDPQMSAITALDNPLLPQDLRREIVRSFFSGPQKDGTQVLEKMLDRMTVGHETKEFRSFLREMLK